MQVCRIHVDNYTIFFCNIYEIYDLKKLTLDNGAVALTVG